MMVNESLDTLHKLDAKETPNNDGIGVGLAATA
jgi:hypothetical protein